MFGDKRFRKSLQLEWISFDLVEPTMHQLSLHGYRFVDSNSYLLLPPSVDEYFNLEFGGKDPIF
jgi:hypothetical protein